MLTCSPEGQAHGHKAGNPGNTAPTRLSLLHVVAVTACLVAAPSYADCPTFTDWVGNDCTVQTWPGGRIPYEFHADISAAQRSAIRKAMDEWENVTGGRILFEQSSTDPSRLVIAPGGCASGLPGKAPSGTKTVQWAASGCPFAHELGHVIGLYHEHQRIDRNRFVDIDPSILVCANYFDVVKQCGAGTDANIGEYDPASVMHYGFPPGASCYMRLKNGSCVPDPSFGTPTGRDASNVRELYAEQEFGWNRFRSLARDIGLDRPLSPEFVDGVTVVGAPALAAQGDGSNNLLVRGSDGQLWHRFRAAGEWSGWFQMGGSLNSSPAAASWGPGTLLVAARLTNGKIGLREFAGSNWSPWSELSPPPGGAASGPALSSWAPKRLNLFVRGNDGALWWRFFSGSSSTAKPTQESNWSTWSSAGGQFVGDPAAASWGPERIDVVVAVADSTIWHWWYVNGATGWDSIGCCIDPTSSPSIASRTANTLNVLMRGSDGDLWHSFWDGNSWSGWSALGGVLTSSPSIAATGPSRLDVVAVGTDQGLKHRFWTPD